MSVVRSFTDSFKVTDWTPELLTVPQQWGTINNLGLFQEEGVEQYSVSFDEVTKDGALIVDRVRGERGSSSKSGTRKTRSWYIPFFPEDDFIVPSEIKGKRAYGSANDEETLAAVRVRKLERLAQNHAWTLEYARAKAITTGDVYSPSGTTSLNFYTEFGVTRKEVDFTLGTGTTNVLAKSEEAVGQILDNSAGVQVTGIVALCSPTFFKGVTTHASTIQAYQYYQSTQEPLRQRLGGPLAMNRQFYHGGVTYIELRDAYGTNPLIPVGDAYFLPTGTDAFQTFFAPANRFDLFGTTGERMYAFEQVSPDQSKITIQSEANFLNAVRRPQLVVRAYSSN